MAKNQQNKQVIERIKLDPIHDRELKIIKSHHYQKLKEIQKKDLQNKVQNQVSKVLNAGIHLKKNDRFRSI